MTLRESYCETFSIVGYDAAEPAWGIAIASRFLAVGAGTCWGRVGAGVVVIQAHFNMRNGEEGLEMLRRGALAGEVIDQLMARDRHRDVRQMGVIDNCGGCSTYTGRNCNMWAGGRTGMHCSAQGNTLVGPQVVEVMVDSFSSSGGSLARRLVGALTAGDAAGGDVRGKEAAALLVVRPDAEEIFDVFSHRTINLRVDDHPEPLRELSRLLAHYELIHYATTPEDRLPVDQEVVVRLQQELQGMGYFDGEVNGMMDDATRAALARLSFHHNLRNRLSSLEWIDRRVLEYVEERGERG